MNQPCSANSEKKKSPRYAILNTVVTKMDLDDILDYIEQNLKRDLTLAELSERYHYSPRQLYYYLHGITGMPIMAYIRKRKLVNAAREISLGRKMYDVALDYGFETQAGFYKNRCEFMDLVVNPTFQKQGLGKRLCQEGCASARKLGCDHVISTCRGKGAEPFFNSAEPFYRAIGMELCGRIPNGFQEPWGDRNKPLMAAYGTCAGSAHSFQ